MTKEEVKGGIQAERGEPADKGAYPSIQKQMAMSRMMQKVPKADVIIRTPRILPWPFSMIPEINNAPVVTAKGQDALALRIVRRVGVKTEFILWRTSPWRARVYGACSWARRYQEVWQRRFWFTSIKTGRKPDMSPVILTDELNEEVNEFLVTCRSHHCPCF